MVLMAKVHYNFVIPSRPEPKARATEESAFCWRRPTLFANHPNAPFLLRHSPPLHRRRILTHMVIPAPIRWTSSATFLEYPLVSIAIGPDLTSNQIRGHARGIIAIGDVATGAIALGGIARGVIALGGLAIGGVVLGGCGIGILTLGGLALGYIAIGGLAIGYAAVGGLAIGYYAMGGAAIGKFTVGPLHQDPQALDFFSRLVRGALMPPPMRPGPR